MMQRRRRLPRHAMVIVAVFMLLAVAGALWLRIVPGAHLAESKPLRIAVLPFENLGPVEDAYFAEGMTDEVRSKLSSLPQLAVIARSSVAAYKGSAKPAELTAKELGVRYLLSGTVR